MNKKRETGYCSKEEHETGVSRLIIKHLRNNTRVDPIVERFISDKDQGEVEKGAKKQDEEEGKTEEEV